jgi:hypothetical protein
MTDVKAPRKPSFLLTAGGPTYRLELRIGLLRANSPRIVRRAFLSILITWVPLLVLSALQGNAMGHLVPVPFLRDLAVHARFLLAVPVLLLAETVLGSRLAHAANHFVTSGLVLEKDFAKFDEAVASGLKGRDSTLAEIVLIFLAYLFAIAGQLSMAVHVSTWYALQTSSGVTLTLAGWWFALLCVPLFQFLSLRWIWRMFLWAQFLWRMDQLDLQLVPTHPDEAGGLGFVGEVQRFFGVILFAYSITVAGVLANGIIYDGDKLEQFALAIAAYVVISVSLVIAPLLVFSNTLVDTKRHGLHQYGTLATEYTSSFHQKWIVEPRNTDEVLLGTGDIQSLADLGNSYAFVERMDAIPTGLQTPVQLALSCLLPMAPLLLTMMPLEEVLKMIFKVIF